VLYLLHGSGHDPVSVMEQVRPQEQLAALGAALLVIPDGDQGWWLDSPLQRRSRYGRYALELVALMDQRYRTLANRTGRGLCGFSMGGYGAMLLASQHPEVFGAASSLLGPLDLAQMFPEYYRLRLLLGSDLEVWQEFNPTRLAARLVHTALHFSTAQEAFDRPQNEAFAAALRSLGIGFEHVVHAGTHDTDWVRAHLRAAAAFHRAAFDRAFH
jgi:S-formylglutathione hydrolase FrmB